MLNVVTGGAGFLGSHLVNALAAAGESVIIIDNLTTGHIRNLEWSISSGYATFIYGDVTMTSPMLAEMINNATSQRVDRVFHFASPSMARASDGMSWESLEANALGTVSLIDLAIAHEATMLFVSSCAVYDALSSRAGHEDLVGLRELADSRRLYEAGKRFGEAAVAAAVRYRGLDGRIVRLFECYGPAMDGRGGLVAELFTCALSSKPFPIAGMEDRVVSVTYVKDVIEMLRTVMEIRHSELVSITVGSDERTTVGDIARAIASLTGCEYRIAESDGSAVLGSLAFSHSSGEIARGHDWKPSTPLPVGLKLVYDWLCSERVAFA